MSENKLVGSLVLRTIDLDTTQTDTTGMDEINGLCTASGGYVIWRNVNIRTCLGELYKNYDRFNLKLIAGQIRHNANAAAEDAQFIIYMSGLPFSSGSCYSTRLGPTNQAAIGCVNFVSSITEGQTVAVVGDVVSFDTPLQDILDITVELKNSSTTTADSYSEKTSTALGHWSILCNIYGIEK